MFWLDDDDVFDGCFGGGLYVRNSRNASCWLVFFNAHLKVPGKQFIVHNMQKEIIRTLYVIAESFNLLKWEF